jgi:pimeloyl-ACP methyl ester carboxylesterase
LLGNDFNVVAYDSPAHNQSSGKQTNLFHNTQALLAVAESLAPIHALIDHSFGTIANNYALALCEENTLLEYAYLARVEKIILIADPNKLTDIFAAFIQAMYFPDSVLSIFHQKVEAISKRKIESMSVTRFSTAYSRQSLLIHDHNDRIVPFAEAEPVTKDSSASLFATTGYGHFHILKTKTVIEKIVNFL